MAAHPPAQRAADRLASTRAALARLRLLRGRFGQTVEADKRALILRLESARLGSLRAVSVYHSDLLFLCAFPGALATRALARQALEQFAPRLRGLDARGRDAALNSGLAGSVTTAPMAFPIAALLATEAGAVEIDWSNLESPDTLIELVARAARPSESDALGSGRFSPRQWFALARRNGSASALQWLLECGTADARERAAFIAAFDAAEVPLRWTLSTSRRAVTHNAVGKAKPRLRRAFRRLELPLAAHVRRPLPGIERLDAKQARAVIGVAQAALAARGREVHAMNYANPHEVWLADLGEGVELAVLGVQIEQRLLLEANYGYLLMANGVPVGYGGVSPLFRQANTGVNIFDPFRGSEAAFLWAQSLRAFRTLFGTRRFVINAYQVGAGNSEAIASGAYWFYYRLGFRPAEAESARLAAVEAARLAESGQQRTPGTLLRRLARGDLCLDLPDFNLEDYFPEALLEALSAGAARRLAAEPIASRRQAELRIARDLAQRLGATGIGRWSLPHRHAFEQLAPIVDLAGPVEKWSARDRTALVELLRAKGAAQEREFAQRAGAHPRLARALVAAGRRFP